MVGFEQLNDMQKKEFCRQKGLYSSLRGQAAAKPAP